jgi:hypothetical protein
LAKKTTEEFGRFAAGFVPVCHLPAEFAWLRMAFIIA